MNQSISEKLQSLFEISIDLAYHPNGIDVFDTDKLYGEKISDIIWGMVDGLYPCYILDRINGRCSIQESINFDLSEIEKRIDNNILMLRELNNDKNSKVNNQI